MLFSITKLLGVGLCKCDVEYFLINFLTIFKNEGLARFEWN